MSNLNYQVPSPGASTHMRRRHKFEVSVTGLVYCSMMMFMGLAAINSQANMLFAVFGLMIGVLLVSGIISKLVLRKLTITREMPEHAVVGRAMNLRYHTRNAKRIWPSLSVTIAELDGGEAFTRQSQAYLLHAAAGMTAIVPASVIAKRRGLHLLDRYQLITSFPFGFIKRAVERSLKDSIVVYPAIAQVNQKAIQMCQSAETSGAQMRPRRGGTDEFYGVKEYRAGENPRWVYWRRSARVGTLVSKEMTHVSPPRMLLMVDTHLDKPSAQGQEAVERVIAIAASLANEALEQGLPIGLLVWSDGWEHLPPNRGKRHRRDVLAMLARLPMNTTGQQHQLLDERYRHMKSGTSAVLITPQELGLSLGDAARGSLVVLSPNAPVVTRWFKFDPSIDFSRCMPAGQQMA